MSDLQRTPDIITAFEFLEEIEGRPPKKRLLGLGEDNNMYVWSWLKGQWNPYMEWSAADRKGLPVPYRDDSSED